MMITVVAALIPCVLFGMYNIGLQAHLAIEGGAQPLDTWQTALMQALGFEFTNSVLNNFLHGALYFIPVIATTFIIGGIIEVGNSIIRGHEVNEGFQGSLTLPRPSRLASRAWHCVWYLDRKRGVCGTGMNVLNPALTGRAFLFFAYPAQISGDKPWIAAQMTDGNTGATWLAKAAADPAAFVTGDFLTGLD